MFKKQYCFEERRAEAVRIISKYPDRIPIICEKNQFTNNYINNTLDKKKYLVPKDLTIGQFTYVLRKRMKLSSTDAIFLFINNIIPQSGESMDKLYDKNKDDDLFLYVLYSNENTFG